MLPFTFSTYYKAVIMPALKSGSTTKATAYLLYGSPDSPQSRGQTLISAYNNGSKAIPQDTVKTFFEIDSKDGAGNSNFVSNDELSRRFDAAQLATDYNIEAMYKACERLLSVVDIPEASRKRLLSFKDDPRMFLMETFRGALNRPVQKTFLNDELKEYLRGLYAGTSDMTTPPEYQLEETPKKRGRKKASAQSNYESEESYPWFNDYAVPSITTQPLFCSDDFRLLLNELSPLFAYSSNKSSPLSLEELCDLLKIHKHSSTGEWTTDQVGVVHFLKKADIFAGIGQDQSLSTFLFNINFEQNEILLFVIDCVEPPLSCIVEPLINNGLLPPDRVFYITSERTRRQPELVTFYLVSSCKEIRFPDLGEPLEIDEEP